MFVGHIGSARGEIDLAACRVDDAAPRRSAVSARRSGRARMTGSRAVGRRPGRAPGRPSSRPLGRPRRRSAGSRSASTPSSATRRAGSGKPSAGVSMPILVACSRLDSIEPAKGWQPAARADQRSSVRKTAARSWSARGWRRMRLPLSTAAAAQRQSHAPRCGVLVHMDLERNAGRCAGQDEARPERDRHSIREAAGRPVATVAPRDPARAAGDERNGVVRVAKRGLALRERPVRESSAPSAAVAELHGDGVARLDEHRELVPAEVANGAGGRVRAADEHERTDHEIARIGEGAGEVRLGPCRAVLTRAPRMVRRRGRRRRTPARDGG
jgi:hypothetical protein